MSDPSKPLWLNQETELGIYVATPVHSDVSIHYTQSLLEFQKACMEKGVKVMFEMIKSSLVTQGRNLCTASFLKSEMSHMLFIDSDIAFSSDSIWSMLEADKDVISVPYPLKDIKFDRLIQKILHGEVTTAHEAHVNCNTYPLRLEDNEAIEIEGEGVIEVTHAPTGCMLIKREVFDTLIKEYPDMEIHQENLIDGKLQRKPYLYNFFDTYYDQENKLFLGEDFAFCRLWRNTGGKCYCYIMDYITHVGEFQYTGRLWDEMKPSSVDTPDKSR